MRAILTSPSTLIRRIRPQPGIVPQQLRRRSQQALLVRIENGTFYRQYPSETDQSSFNPPIFPGLCFEQPINTSTRAQHWAIVSPASQPRTTFLRILNNEYICVPPTARSYPYLSSDRITDPRLRSPEHAIQYVGFDAERGGLGGTSLKGAYLSARYEARKEETDWSVRDYLQGNTELNALEKGEDSVDMSLLASVVDSLRLKDLLDRPVSNLSNGQTRRARIAKTLLRKPELLLLDGPFMGLDPFNAQVLSDLLGTMAARCAPRIVLSLRPEDHLPKWITHLMYIDQEQQILSEGTKTRVCKQLTAPRMTLGNPKQREASRYMRRIAQQVSGLASAEDTPPHQANAPELAMSRDAFPKHDPPSALGEAVVEMQGVRVSYGPKDSTNPQTTVLGDWIQKDAATGGEEKEGLHWTIHRGQRWGIFGPNGSGKTTLVSLITSDHPQAYSLPIKTFGRSRLPGPGEKGMSIFELQRRIGHSSPEVHAYFPKHLSVRRVLESAWADAPLSKPTLTHAVDRRIDACLRWFATELGPPGASALEQLKVDLRTTGKRPDVARHEAARARLQKLTGYADDLDWADSTSFGELAFSQQRLVLFLRAIVAAPDVVILDEAFSGMDENTRDKCLLFLSHGEKLDLLTNRRGLKAVSHYGEDPAAAIGPSIIAENDVVVLDGLNEKQVLLVISHSQEDVPGCVRDWICLPEAGTGEPARWGSLPGPLELNPQGWEEIWGLEKS